MTHPCPHCESANTRVIEVARSDGPPWFGAVPPLAHCICNVCGMQFHARPPVEYVPRAQP